MLHVRVRKGSLGMDVGFRNVLTNRKVSRKLNQTTDWSADILFYVVPTSWKKPTRCCGPRRRRRRGSVKHRRRAASRCSSWRPMCASCRTNAACWSATSWVWRRNASACRLLWRRRGGSKARAQRPSVTLWVGDTCTVCNTGSFVSVEKRKLHFMRLHTITFYLAAKCHSMHWWMLKYVSYHIYRKWNSCRWIITYCSRRHFSVLNADTFTCIFMKCKFYDEPWIKICYRSRFKLFSCCLPCGLHSRFIKAARRVKLGDSQIQREPKRLCRP